VTAERTCDLSPFVSPVVAQVGTLEQAGSALEILTQNLENFLARFKAAVCDDLTEIVEECCGGVGPVEISFLELTDTPSTYAGAAGQAVAVNAGATGLEFVDFPSPEPADVDIAEKWVNFSFGLVAGTPLQTIGNGGGTSSPAATSTVPALASTTNSTSRYKVQFISANGTNQICFVITGSNTNLVAIGDSAGDAGFRYRSLIGQNTAIANQRAFWGLRNATANPTSVDPSTYTNVIGFGYDDDDTNINLIHNDAPLTATMTDLGANFPIATGELYDMQLSAEPGSGEVSWSITRVNTGDTASGTITTDLPAGSVFLSLYAWVATAATSGQAQMWFSKLYIGYF
jgi:hypothetical protein